jgi:capsular polysaccharide biosynthesis protein
MKILELNDEYDGKKELFLEKDENCREIWIYHINNCILTGRSLYYPNVLLYSLDKVLYLPYRERTMSLKQGTIYEKYNMEFDIRNLCSIEISEESNIYKSPVFFFIYNTDNYYHFLYDTLPFLITFRNLKEQYTDLKLLINYPNEQSKKFYKFILETLELFNLQNQYIIADEYKNIIFEKVIVSTSYTHDINSNLPPRNEIYDLYKSMVLNAKEIITNNIISNTNANNKINNTTLNDIKLYKKIYISRRTWTHNDLSNIGTNYTTRRLLVNETELVNYLILQGYKEIFTENMSMIEKILLFDYAESIIGAIGGGIANVIFSKAETQLITLVSPGFLDINMRFKYCLDIVNNIYFNYCYHQEIGKYKKYMRVKMAEEIGEIEEVNDEELLVKYTDGSNTGWNSQCEYKTKKVNCNEVKILDNGLNSAWYVDIKKLEQIV